MPTAERAADQITNKTNFLAGEREREGRAPDAPVVVAPSCRRDTRWGPFVAAEAIVVFLALPRHLDVM